jgi:nucleoside-diphosphate-sugar epimerase
MNNKSVLVTGSCGLIGSELCVHFYQAGYSVVGINNNQRGVFLALREIHLGRRNAGAARFLRTRSQHDSRRAKEFFAWCERSSGRFLKRRVVYDNLHLGVHSNASMVHVESQVISRVESQ